MIVPGITVYIFLDQDLSKPFFFKLFGYFSSELSAADKQLEYSPCYLLLYNPYLILLKWWNTMFLSRILTLLFADTLKACNNIERVSAALLPDLYILWLLLQKDWQISACILQSFAFSLLQDLQFIISFLKTILAAPQDP
jgi:hypothetical protein